MILILLRISSVVWVTVSVLYFIMNIFDIHGLQWFILFPIYSLFDIGIGVFCFFLSIITMLRRSYKYYFKNESNNKEIEMLFETIIIFLIGILLTFIHSWWK